MELFAFPTDGSPKAASGEFCCVAHALLLVSCRLSFYRRSSTNPYERVGSRRLDIARELHRKGEAMTTCNHCGANTPASHRFCVDCGGPIETRIISIGPLQTKGPKRHNWMFWVMWAIIAVLGLDLLAIISLDNSQKVALNIASITNNLIWPLIVVSLGLLYFLPTIVGRNKRNANAIMMLNIFLGWTFIGWVIALVWAMTVDQENIQKRN
jgi:hypothetical protein